jgi:hypothetical protein
MSKHWLYPFFTPIGAPKGKRVYVSGPMTGYEDHNYPAFHQAATALRTLGYAVCNPAETDLALASSDQKLETYLRFDAERVLEADFLVALKDWERSRGATWEILTAVRIGTPVWGWENWHDYDRITEARVFAAISDLYSGKTITVNQEAKAKALAEGGAGDTEPRTWQVGKSVEVREGPSDSPQQRDGTDSLVRPPSGPVEVIVGGEVVLFFEDIDSAAMFGLQTV